MGTVILLSSSLSLFIIKASNLGLRLSDSNIYFYTAYQLLKGKVLYKDIFFTNLPVFPYLATSYFYLIGKNIVLFYLTATLEVLATGFLIYKILKRNSDEELIPVFATLIYIFSFIVLSTTDHQTGVFAASFFSVLSYFFLTRNKFLLSGVSLGISLCIKAYFLPIILSFILYVVFKERNKIFKFLAGFLGSVSLIVLPFLIVAQKEFVSAVFSYSLGRPAGLSKLDVLKFFITHDSLLFIFFVFNLFNLKRNLFFFLISIFSILLIVFYGDFYYLYLNFLVPFLVLSLGEFYKFLKKLEIPNINTVFSLLVIFLLSLNFLRYAIGFSQLQKVNNINQITSTIEKSAPEFLFGTNDLTPALAYLTNTPLLNGIIDTNENIFNKGLLNSEKLTDDALSKKTVIVTHGANYQEFNIDEKITDKIFNKSKILEKCKLLLSTPTRMEGTNNRINLFRCY